MVSAAHTPSHARRAGSAWRALLAAFAATFVVAASLGIASASTPVTAGYRDQAYGGGAFRPAGDKPQSKLWYTDGSWFAGMFNVATAKFDIYRLNPTTHSWVDTGVVADKRDTSHADYLWDEATQTLVVASMDDIPLAGVAVPDDGLKIFKYSYNAATNAYTLAPGFPRTVPNTTSAPNTTTGGAPTVTIARDSNGRLWTAWPRNQLVNYSISDDAGATWSTPAGVPAQGGNTIRDGVSSDTDSTAVVAFNSSVGILWSDHDGAAGNTTDGFYFAVIAAGADPTVGGNWTLEKLPSLLGPTAGEWADNHVNVKVASDGAVYAVGKTGKDTAGCATNKNLPLVEAFKRTTAGTWSVALVSTVGDCSTRPQIVLDEQLGVAYVFLTSPNGGGIIYRKSAPLSGSEALKFRGAADTSFQPGTPFVASATETLIDDPTTTKQLVTSTSGLVVLGNNLIKAGTSNAKYYLHNEMALPASDATAPSGSITIAGGAATTGTTAVSVAVPATDAGTGVSFVRLSNSSATTGGVLSSGTTFGYTTPVAWTLAAGDGTKTVYAQWRDGAGNWSTPVSDTILLDATAPTGTVSIDGGAASTTTLNVTLDLTTNDGAGSGTTNVIIANSADFAGAVTEAYAASIPWQLSSGQGTKTVYVKFVDAVGNTSTAVSDTITLTGETTPPTAPGIPIHRLGGISNVGIGTHLSWTAGTDANSGVAGYDVERSIDGGATYAYLTSPTINAVNFQLRTGLTWKFRIRTRDNAGNVSAWVYGQKFRADSYVETHPLVKYSGSWLLSGNPVWFGGRAKYSSQAGATATFTFTGNRVGWLSRLTPSYGSARVYINNVLARTVNLSTATTINKTLVFNQSWSTNATRTIKIVVVGPAGHPVPIDGFFVMRDVP
jgi:hypothetical protein